MSIDDKTLNAANSKKDCLPMSPWTLFRGEAGSIKYAAQVYQLLESEFGVGQFCLTNEGDWWSVEERLAITDIKERFPELKDALLVVLFFTNETDREEFIEAVKQEHPGFQTRKL